jgi:hypothetical protein
MRSAANATKVTAQRSLVPVLQRIADMADLPSNWDSYGALPLTARAVARACLLVTAIAEEGEPSGNRLLPWTSAPIADGGLQIEWTCETARIDVQVSPDGTLGYLIQRGTAEAAEYQEDEDLEMEAMVKLVTKVLAA